MSEQSVHQQKKTDVTEQQNIYIKKGDNYYEKIKICRQLCSDILRVRL